MSANALISMALPGGSGKDRVDCSPTSSLNLIQRIGRPASLPSRSTGSTAMNGLLVQLTGPHIREREGGASIG